MSLLFVPPKAYQGSAPTASGLLQQRWDKMYWQQHRSRVANAKSYVDTSAPKQYPHMQERLKFYVMEEHRAAVIQRDNYTLLTKMADIMEGRVRRRVDNWNKNRYRSLSLNAGHRHRIQWRIAQENQGVLARIEASRPHYDHRKWLKDWLENKGYQAYIAKYPHAGTVHAQTFRGRKIKGAPKPSGYKEGTQIQYWATKKI